MSVARFASWKVVKQTPGRPHRQSASRWAARRCDRMATTGFLPVTGTTQHPHRDRSQCRSTNLRWLGCRNTLQLAPCAPRGMAFEHFVVADHEEAGLGFSGVLQSCGHIAGVDVGPAFAASELLNHRLDRLAIARRMRPSTQVLGSHSISRARASSFQRPVRLARRAFWHTSTIKSSLAAALKEEARLPVCCLRELWAGGHWQLWGRCRCGSELGREAGAGLPAFVFRPPRFGCLTIPPPAEHRRRVDVTGGDWAHW